MEMDWHQSAKKICINQATSTSTLLSVFIFPLSHPTTYNVVLRILHRPEGPHQAAFGSAAIDLASSKFPPSAAKKK